MENNAHLSIASTCTARNNLVVISKFNKLATITQNVLDIFFILTHKNTKK